MTRLNKEKNKELDLKERTSYQTVTKWKETVRVEQPVLSPRKDPLADLVFLLKLNVGFTMLYIIFSLSFEQVFHWGVSIAYLLGTFSCYLYIRKKDKGGVK